MVLDIIFIVVFHMGVAGAAIATVIAQAGSAIASIIYLHHLMPDRLPSLHYLYAWKKQASLLTSLSLSLIHI